MATVTVGEEDLRRLANARAAAVRDRLSEQGKVPRERLFVVAPLLDGSGEAKLPPTRVDFSLK
jgi:outer membrane protein OmpA-like peptidoglycan-associated protein